MSFGSSTFGGAAFGALGVANKADSEALATTQAASVVTSRIVARSLTAAQAATASRLAAAARSTAVAGTQAPRRIYAVARSCSATQAAVATQVRAMAGQRAVGAAQSLICADALARAFAGTQAETVSIAVVKAQGFTAGVTQPATVTAAGSLSRTFDGPQTQAQPSKVANLARFRNLSQSEAVAKVVARSLATSATQAQAVTLAVGHGHNRTLACPQSQDTGMSTAAARSYVLTAPNSVVIGRALPGSFTAGQRQSSTMRSGSSRSIIAVITGEIGDRWPMSSMQGETYIMSGGASSAPPTAGVAIAAPQTSKAV